MNGRIITHQGGTDDPAKRGGLGEEIELHALRFSTAWEGFEKSGAGDGREAAFEDGICRRRFSFVGQVVRGNPDYELADSAPTGTLRYSRGARPPREVSVIIMRVEEEMEFATSGRGGMDHEGRVQGWGWMLAKPSEV